MDIKSSILNPSRLDKSQERAEADLKSKITKFPTSPGVYQYVNKSGEIIYIGKAKNLKNRISQYLNGHDTREQIPYLLAEATDIQYTVVSNELESLYLENTLIKKHLPKYNILLRDDKNYAFITIDYDFEIPQIGYARKFDPQSSIKNLKSKIKYFGPYSAAYKIRNTLNLVRRIFPFCSHAEVSGRPCFYYYLHRCPGVCIGKISLEEYTQQLERIEWFLSGNTGKIAKELKTEMQAASREKRFEAAARLRDQLQAIELLDEKQSVILPKPVSWDLVSLAFDSGYACVNLFKVRQGKMLDKENFVYELSSFGRHPESDDRISSADEGSHEILHQMTFGAIQNDAGREILQKFLEQYYLETSDAPKTIYTQFAAQDSELVSHIIRSRFNRVAEIIAPQKGKPKELTQLGVTNAQEYLKNWLETQGVYRDRINAGLTELKEKLGLKEIPKRIEGYDISNIQGTNPVGSMVVMKDGLPAKSEYRKFKIQGKKTPDDFAMMREILQRRISRNSKNQKTRTKREEWPLPDLMVIDGGKGQLGVAVEVLKEYHLDIPIIGLAKRIEEIFFPKNSKPLVLSYDNPGLQMLQRLRDEAHRFGITFHRKLRSKQAVTSALDDIPGIGPKTKKLLKQKFGTVAQMRKTPFHELAAVVGERIAELIAGSL